MAKKAEPATQKIVVPTTEAPKKTQRPNALYLADDGKVYQVRKDGERLNAMEGGGSITELKALQKLELEVIAPDQVITILQGGETGFSMSEKMAQDPTAVVKAIPGILEAVTEARQTVASFGAIKENKGKAHPDPVVTLLASFALTDGQLENVQKDLRRQEKLAANPLNSLQGRLVLSVVEKPKMVTHKDDKGQTFQVDEGEKIKVTVGRVEGVDREFNRDDIVVGMKNNRLLTVEVAAKDVGSLSGDVKKHLARIAQEAPGRVFVNDVVANKTVTLTSDKAQPVRTTLAEVYTKEFSAKPVAKPTQAKAAQAKAGDKKGSSPKSEKKDIGPKVLTDKDAEKITGVVTPVVANDGEVLFKAFGENEKELLLRKGQVLTGIKAGRLEVAMTEKALNALDLQTALAFSKKAMEEGSKVTFKDDKAKAAAEQIIYNALPIELEFARDEWIAKKGDTVLQGINTVELDKMIKKGATLIVLCANDTPLDYPEVNLTHLAAANVNMVQEKKKWKEEFNSIFKFKAAPWVTDAEEQNFAPKETRVALMREMELVYRAEILYIVEPEALEKPQVIVEKEELGDNTVGAAFAAALQPPPAVKASKQEVLPPQPTKVAPVISATNSAAADILEYAANRIRDGVEPAELGQVLDVIGKAMKALGGVKKVAAKSGDIIEKPVEQTAGKSK